MLTLKADNLLENYVQYIGDTQSEGARPQDFFLQRYAEAYCIEWNHFVDIMAKKAVACVSGVDGEKALQLADAAQASLESGKTVKL